MRIRNLLLGACAVCGLALAAPASAAGKPVYGAWGYDPSAMDSSVKPGDDFWAYVNGTWNQRAQIASDRTSTGYGVKLTEAAEVNVRSILDAMAKDPARYGESGTQLGEC